jgi:hypothetical protein
VELLRAAAEYVRGQGGRIVEGYPSLPSKRLADAWVYTGTAATYERAGFVEVARPSRSTAIMRLVL